MSLQLAYDGAKRYLRQNPRQPYELIHVASKSGEVLRIAFEKPMLPTRLVFPATHADNSHLYKWRPKMHPTHGLIGNPWKRTNHQYQVSHEIGTIKVNSGSSVLLHKGLSYGTSFQQSDVKGWNCWALDKENHKYEFTFYVNNNLEETDPTVIIDDGGVAFWTVWYSGSGSNRPTLTESDDSAEKAKGTDSYKIIFSAGAYTHSRFYHLYGSGQVWSEKEYDGLYIYGSNSGHVITVWISADSGANGWGTDGYKWNITDNWTGWKRVVLPLNDPDGETGNPNLAAVRKVVVDLGAWAGETSGTLRFDRMLVDVGQWVKVETHVPDSMVETTQYGRTVDKARLYSWTGSEWVGGLYYLDWNRNVCGVFDSGYLYLLDGSVLEDIMGDQYKGGCLYQKNTRGQAGANYCAQGTMDCDAGAMTYNDLYGLLNFLGFAIKLPPDDGQDSSTTGISQCKLKWEIFYDDSEDPAGFQGQATYEFNPDAGGNLGLNAVNDTWFCLCNTTLKRAWHFITDMELNGFKVNADEDEYIHWIEIILQAGCRVFRGELHHANMTTDSSGEGVPDFLEGTVIPGLCKGVPSWL